MKDTGKLLYWTPRILSIIFICFLSILSVDIYQPGMSIGEILIGLFMHNIPTLVLIILLVIAWKKEIIGAISFIGAGAIYIGMMIFNIIESKLLWYIGISWSLTIAGPAFLIGILFYLNWQKRKKGS